MATTMPGHTKATATARSRPHSSGRQSIRGHLGLVALGGGDLAQREDPLGVAFLFEELLAGLEEVELGDEPVEAAGDRAGSTTGSTPRPRAAIRSATERRISSGWATDGEVIIASCTRTVRLVLAGEDGRPRQDPEQTGRGVDDRVETLAARGGAFRQCS